MCLLGSLPPQLAPLLHSPSNGLMLLPTAWKPLNKHLLQQQRVTGFLKGYRVTSSPREEPPYVPRRPLQSARKESRHQGGGKTARHRAHSYQQELSAGAGRERREFLAGLLLAATLASPLGSAEASSSPLGPSRNSEILNSLKKLEQSKSVANGEVLSRLMKAQAQLQRATVLASAGEYRAARELLRTGPVGSIRDDLKSVAAYVQVERPTFDAFEAVALIGALEAFDNAVKAVAKGSEEVTTADIVTDGRLMLNAMEAVVSVAETKLKAVQYYNDST